MKKIILILLLPFITTLFALYSPEEIYSYLQKKYPLNIRVLLVKPSEANKSWQLRLDSENGFLVKQYLAANKTLLIKDKTLILSVKNNLLFIQTNKSEPRKVTDKNLFFIPMSKYIVVNGTPYEGTISIHHDGISPKIVNHVSLDDYVYGILRYEIFPHWPIEMHKVQAIISRSYALSHLLNSRKKNKLYDIKNTKVHQTYNGYHTHEHLRIAVNETKNMVLTFDKKIAMTMFDTCCGGIIPAHVKGIHFNKAPYLARKTPCLYCQNYKLFSWKKKLNLKSDNFKEKIKRIGTFNGLKVLEKDKAGLVKKIQILGSRNNISYSTKEVIPSMISKPLSLSFDIKKDKANFFLEGKGIGHQIGLCQRGAYELVKNGWNFKKILYFYYPKTTLSLLNFNA